MKGILPAAALLCTTASALFIPPILRHPRTPVNDFETVTGSTDLENTIVRFSTPCKGCFIGTQDGLQLELSIPRADGECIVAPSINGLPLYPQGLQGISHGDIIFKTNLSNGLGEREINASWESQCLNGEATFLSVNVHGVLGSDQVKEASGFSISFKQHDQPTVLRLHGKPTGALSHEAQESWMHPDGNADLKFTVDSGMGQTEISSALQEEYRVLEGLKIQLGLLHREIAHQESKMFAMIKEDFGSCHDISCMLRTAVKTAPQFAELIKTHFRHHPKDSRGKSSCSWFKTVEKPIGLTDEHSPDETIAQFETSPGPGDDAPFSFGQDEGKDHGHPADGSHGPPPTPSDEHDDDVSTFDNGGMPPPPPSDGRGDQPFPHGENLPPHPPHGMEPPSGPEGHPHPPFPFPPGRRPHGPPANGEHLPPSSPPPQENPHHPAPMPHDGPSHHRPHMPHHDRSHRHHKPLFAAAALILFLVITAALFKMLRIYFLDPRRRVDRAARKEECRTRRAYKQAACRHKLKQVMSRFRRRASSASNADYEEKRAILRRQTDEDDTSSDILRVDINSLRRANEIVGELMRAEEGRTRLHHEVNFGMTNQSQESAPIRQQGPGSSSDAQSINTLPPYAPPPPRYEEELSDDMEVVDGFRYTPSNSAATVSSSASSFMLDDECTESSVVDCRSQVSFETESVERSRKSLELAGDRMGRDL